MMVNFLEARWVGRDDRRLGDLRHRKIFLVTSPSDSTNGPYRNFCITYIWSAELELNMVWSFDLPSQRNTVLLVHHSQTAGGPP